MTDLVVETWALDGTCGAQEATVAEKVPADTKRPPETEDEIGRLLRRSQEVGIRPHGLVLSCADYASLLDEAGEVRYDALLGLLTLKLQEMALAGLDVPDARLVLYGGAVHNDLTPTIGQESYSYAPEVQRKAGLDYVELDLYVPEVVAAQANLQGESWFPLLEGVVGPDRVVLVPRGPNSFILLLQTTPPNLSP
jgi:hypothetical protein